MDWFTIFIYLLLVSAGAVSIYAASYDFDNASIFDFSEFSGKQFLWIGLSLIIGCVILLLDYRIYETYAYPIYGVVILILIATIFLAPDIKGSRSWLVFGPVSLQPAEFGKFATALALAKLFNSYNFSLNAKISNYFRALILIFLPICLILLQRETGSALVYFSLIFVLYREGMSGLVLFSVVCAIVYFVVAVKFSEPIILGIPVGEFSVFLIIILIFSLMLIFYCRDFIIARNVILGFVGSGILVTILSLCGVTINGTIYFCVILSLAVGYTLIGMFHHRIEKFLITICFAVVSVLFLFSVNYVFGNILEPHQQTRIKVALGIEEDLRGAGYNVNQSKIAIGSGGLTGKGFLNGTQTKLKYVPEQHTDFIFCTIGEEEGFIGSITVLALFTALILRLIYIAERQRTSFGRVYAYCVVSCLIFHLCINIGMVIGLCPVIGIPLPFFSYGGSALWGFTIFLFILLRIDASRKERRD
ncbi:MAG: rod shape-determining protein RodA [Muribaculaceae bacterium]|nr:rod shape-determining protein RodA [Muribaculaceae bacterium]MDE7109070.1 rod shape-determining protein RodA [Muribaculaceae bacterium]